MQSGRMPIMFKKLKLVSLFGIACALPTVASANNFDYNFLEVRTTVSPQSSGLEYSHYFTDNSHYIVRGDSRFSQDWDLAAGMGFNGPFGNFADIFGEALLHQIREDDENGGNDTTKVEISVGTRVWISDQFEGSLRLGKLGTGTVFITGIRFHSTDQLSVALESRNAGIWGSQIGISVRFGFK